MEIKKDFKLHFECFLGKNGTVSIQPKQASPNEETQQQANSSLTIGL